jgi:hypothetical protein
MKRSIVVVGLLLAVALVMPVPLQAHQGHKVVGIVTGIDASHLEVKDRAGKTVSISLTADTKYRKPGATAGASAQSAGAADVKVGQRVAVSVMHEGEKMTATEVTLGVEGSGGGQGKPHAQQH